MSDLENNIDNMTNIEIEGNILSLNIKQLENIKSASYLNIFNAIITLKKILGDKEEADDTRFNEELDLFYKYVDKFINSMTESINKLDSENKMQLEDSKKIRQELYELLAIVDGYLIELSYVGEFVDQYGIKLLSKKNYSDTTYDSKKIDELIIMINHILTETKDDYNKYIYIISQIISILPMRLVKDNYYDIIKDTITRNFKSYNNPQIENQINNYKKQFDGSIRDGYGTKFDYYFREIQKIRRIDLKDKTLENLGDIVNEIILLTKEINELLDVTIRLGLVSNMNMVIKLTDKISNTSEIENIYNDWIKVLRNKNKKEIKEFRIMIGKEIGNIEQDIFKDLNDFEALNIEALKREDFNYDELSEELTYTKTVLTYYNDNKFSDYNSIFPEYDESTSDEYLEQSVNSLIQYMNRSIPKMNNIERKTRMRKLLSLVELPFDGIEDFSKYINYSLDNKIMPEEEINFTIDHILYFLNDIVKS